MLDYKEILNEEQYEAAIHTNGPALVLAGAGTGKTMTLVYRVVHMIESGILPGSILLLTFTNKAAKEMRDRADKLDARCKDITASTYHSFCCRLMRIYSKRLHIPHNFTILDTGDVTDVIRMVMEEMKIKGGLFPSAKELSGMISTSINKMEPLSSVIERSKYSDQSATILEIANRTQTYKFKKGMIGYDDMLLCIHELLKNNPDIAKELSEKYRYIMVDEYQDTNDIQNEIISMIAKNHQNIMVVGDDAQSIYAFRGSNVKNIIEFPKRWDNCKVIKLVENYRSTQEILNLSNDVMKNNMTEGIQKDLQSALHKEEINPKPVLYHTYDNSTEGKLLLEKIMELHGKGINYHDIAVLVRASRQSAELEKQLAIHHIEFDKYGGQKFFEKQHIREVLCMLRVLDNPRDTIAWFRVLQLLPGIGDGFGKKIADLCSQKGFQGLIDNPYKRRAFYKELCGLKESFEELSKIIDLPTLLQKCCDYHYELTNKKIAKSRIRDKREAYEKNEATMEDFQVLMGMADDDMTIRDFLAELALDESDPKEEESDKLIISTVHSAKGLEYDYVLIPDCFEGSIPKITKNTTEDSIAEELRCFYVAMTRAKKELYLFFPEWSTRDPRKYELSSFLEMSGSCLEVENDSPAFAMGF